MKTDRLPDGKRACEPLREMIAKVAQDIKDGIDGYRARSTTLNSFYDEYISMKYELKDSTLNSYKYFWRKFIKDAIGHMEVGAIKFSDIKKFYISLIRVNGFKPNSVENIQTILHPVFAAAVRDGYIRTNPTEGVLKEIKKSHNWEKPKRHALTEAQQRRFISYVARSKVYSHWLPLFTVLLGTGGRISEILGLRWEDCDFDHCLISINHNLIYRQMDDGKMAYQITTPKTESGKRIVPMFSEVKAILQSLPRDACSSTVDGCSGFIFSNRYGEILNPHAVNRAIDRIIRDANLEEGEHETLPHFSVHNLRHTFCTRMCENEPNIKIIQEIMGHRDIQTTMDVYIVMLIIYLLAARNNIQSGNHLLPHLPAIIIVDTSEYTLFSSFSLVTILYLQYRDYKQARLFRLPVDRCIYSSALGLRLPTHGTEAKEVARPQRPGRGPQT